jgi:hypothetical protein
MLIPIDTCSMMNNNLDFFLSLTIIITDGDVPTVM